MTETYTAIQAVAPGVLELVQRPIVQPGPGEVRLRVEACGICHSDRWTVEGAMVPIAYPRVPGHEAVGRIDAVGDGVEGWELGQRVGVGFLAGPCGKCAMCKRGDFTRCQNQSWTGIHHDGGYAEVMIAKASALVAIPDDLASVEAAPLLCAGITVFKALKKSGAQAGDTVAVHGIGGLGHLAVQFARKMGFRTIAIARGAEKAADALQLGAHHYVDSNADDAAATLRALGGVDLLLSTVSSPKAAAPLVAGMNAHGKVLMVGVAAEAIEVSPVDLVANDISFHGSLTGTTAETEGSLVFSALQQIRTVIETMPLSRAREAYDRMSRNEAKYRLVLTMGEEAA